MLESGEANNHGSEGPFLRIIRDAHAAELRLVETLKHANPDQKLSDVIDEMERTLEFLKKCQTELVHLTGIQDF